MALVATISASLVGLFASLSLYWGWKNQQRLFVLLGWSGLAATIPLWALSLGWEYGVIFALSAPAIFVWLGIFTEQKWQNTKVINTPYSALKWNTSALIKQAAWIFHHLIILMVCSSLISIAFVHLLPLEKTNQIACTIIALPLVWGVLSCWQLMALKKWPAFLFSLLGACFSALYLFV